MAVAYFDNPLPLVTDRCDFAAAHGRELQSVCRRHHAVMLPIEGSGMARTAQGEQQVGPGCLIVTRCGDLAETWLAPGTRRWLYDWAVFLPEHARWLSQAEGGGRSRVVEGLDGPMVERLAAAMADLRHWFRSAVPGREALLANTQERLLLLLALVDPAAGGQAGDARVRRIILHLQQELASRISLHGLARQVGLSPSRMIHLFTREVGIPPLRYLEELRLKRACQLLADPELGIAAVASHVGFEDPFHFTKRFTAKFAVSPSRWRRRHGGAPPAVRA